MRNNKIQTDEYEEPKNKFFGHHMVDNLSANDVYQNSVPTTRPARKPKYFVKFKNYYDQSAFKDYNVPSERDKSLLYEQLLFWSPTLFDGVFYMKGKFVPQDQLKIVIPRFDRTNQYFLESFFDERRLYGNSTFQSIYSKYPEKFFISVFGIRGLLLPRSMFTDESQPTLDNLFEKYLEENNLELRRNTLIEKEPITRHIADYTFRNSETNQQRVGDANFQLIDGDTGAQRRIQQHSSNPSSTFISSAGINEQGQASSTNRSVSEELFNG